MLWFNGGLTLFVCYGLMEVLFVFANIALVECLLVGKTISGGLVVGKTISGRLVPLVACLPLVLSCFACRISPRYGLCSSELSLLSVRAA